ncbi:MAG: hypothetical protein HDS60_04385 [Barnesiella sp.]|nr:hypothetical protein [Barnesiella sp.]
MLFSSCADSGQEDSRTINDSLIERQPEVISIREININGKWESKDNPLYPILEFKGKSTVLITTILGQLAFGYERDEEFIRIRTDQSDLLFEIVAEDSIVGSGFAKGVWIKEK